MPRSNLRSNLVFYYDLALLVSLPCLLLLAVYVLPVPALRIALGLLYLLFFPGYSLVAALFPGNDRLSIAERIILSFGMSITVVPLLSLLLHFSPLGIQLVPLLVVITSFLLLCSGVAYYRRSRLSPEERFPIRLEFDLSRWQRMPLLDKVLSILLALSVMAAVGALVYAVAKPKPGERFTEFYILGVNGTAEGYPREVVVGEQVDLIIGVTNHEYSDVHYRIERVDPSGVEQVVTIRLAHDETWEQPHTFALTQAGADQKVEFLLYKQGETKPYRSLYLWITVNKKQ